MKRILSVAIATCFALSALAEDFNLYIIDSANEKTAYAVNDLQKITFDNGSVVITANDGTTASFSISGISQMYFNTEAADGINAIDQAAIRFDGQAISFTGRADRVTVCQPNGTLVATGTDLQGSSLSLADLPTGIYIVNIDGKGFKVVKQ